MASADKIIADALELDEKDRARVAHELLRSLNDGEEAGAAEQWTDELRRRLREVEEGSVELVSFDELKVRMAERRAKRRSNRP